MRKKELPGRKFVRGGFCIVIWYTYICPVDWEFVHLYAGVPSCVCSHPPSISSSSLLANHLTLALFVIIVIHHGKLWHYAKKGACGRKSHLFCVGLYHTWHLDFVAMPPELSIIIMHFTAAVILSPLRCIGCDYHVLPSQLCHYDQWKHTERLSSTLAVSFLTCQYLQAADPL